jgi:hypothetical protein
MAFAAGRHALAICDRCGWEYKHSELIEEWNGLMTCTECHEEKHPQLFPRRHLSDSEALKDPRPARKEAVVFSVGGVGWSGEDKKDLIFKFEIGKITVSIS